MIKPSVDTDLIGKFIWEELYRSVLKNNTDQTIIAKKLWIKPNWVSVYLTGKTTTRNIEQYWRIANAIPISRKEFDQIVEDAKVKVLWIWTNPVINNDPDETIKFALNSKGWKQNDIDEMMNFMKFKEGNK